MTFIDWLCSLPLWGKVFVGFLGADLVLMFGLASLRVNLMANKITKEIDLMRQLIQEMQNANLSIKQNNKTLSLILGMKVSERDERQAKAHKDDGDKAA